MTISYPRNTPSGLENDWFLSGKSRCHSRLDFVGIEDPIWRIDWPIGSASKELALKNN
ncbi:hypothetical protein GCM10007921_42000 [Tritonibacter mobilis]|nr:hypothetical protein GCM10007921_42000 [Tritonibacter mobilis]SDX74484.1 hypothetical protein SAMN05444385_11256 [Tritonibacter mobilis]